jgi:hypothetical protein
MILHSLENVNRHNWKNFWGQQYITITILDIIHRPILYLKHNVSETGLCLCLQVNLLSWIQQKEQVPVFGNSGGVGR